MPPPVPRFWETTDLLICVLSLLPWQDVIAMSHINQRLRCDAQYLVNSRINGLLSNFMHHHHIARLWKELDVSGAAISGELPLALLTRGPSSYIPMGNVLEFVIPLGKTNQLLHLFQRMGYRALDTIPAHVRISPSTGMAQVYCLQAKSRRNPPNVCMFFLSPV